MTFIRIGRNHNPPPYEVDATDMEDLTEAIWLYVRGRLSSLDSSVSIDDDGTTGRIYAGIRDAGSFTIAEKKEEIANA